MKANPGPGKEGRAWVMEKEGLQVACIFSHCCGTNYPTHNRLESMHLLMDRSWSLESGSGVY